MVIKIEIKANSVHLSWSCGGAWQKSPFILLTIPCKEAALLAKDILMAWAKLGLLRIPGNSEGLLLKTSYLI